MKKPLNFRRNGDPDKNWNVIVKTEGKMHMGTMLREGYDPPISRSPEAVKRMNASINPMSLAP